MNYGCLFQIAGAIILKIFVQFESEMLFQKKLKEKNDYSLHLSVVRRFLLLLLSSRKNIFMS